MHGRPHRKGIQCRRLGRENEQYEQAIKKGDAGRPAGLSDWPVPWSFRLDGMLKNVKGAA